MLSTDREGTIAELAIAKAVIGRGIDVYRPLGEGGRYDLNFDLGERLSRVQCKWAPLRGDVVFVNAYSSRRTANGLLKRRYLSCEIDAIAAYCSDLDRCSHVPAWYLETRLQLSLRLPPCRNNQAAGVNWADAFGFEHLQ